MGKAAAPCGVRWDNAEPGTSTCSQAEEPAPSLPDLGLLCMDRIKVLIEGHPAKEGEPWCHNSPGCLHENKIYSGCLPLTRAGTTPLGSAAGSSERKDHCTTMIYVSYPPIISRRRVQGSPCCLCPLTPCLFLCSCSLSQMITQHTFKGPA